MKKKKLSKVIGYVVFNKFNGPLAIVDDMNDDVLWCHVEVSIFETKLEANNAIKRSLKYAAENGYDDCSAWQNFYVKPVRRVK